MFAVSRHTLEMDALRRTHDVRAAELSEQVTQLQVRLLLHVPYVGSYTPGQPGIILQVFLQVLYLASHYIDAERRGLFFSFLGSFTYQVQGGLAAVASAFKTKQQCCPCKETNTFHAPLYVTQALQMLHANPNWLPCKSQHQHYKVH